MKKKSYSNKRQNSLNIADILLAYLHIHAHALFSSLGRLVRNPFNSSLTIIVMSIAISLASGFYLLVVNLQQLTGNIEATNQISLFLKSNVDNKAGERLAAKISKNKNLESVDFISKDKALKEFKAYSGFGDALNALDSNPLPAVIQVLPKNSLDDIQAIENLMAEFNQYPQVDYAQMDMQWIKRLQSMMLIMQRSVFLLSILLGFAVLFITGNIIRLELQSRSDEVLVSKLVGATHSFIQRPFLYTGFWLGLFAGVTAWILVSIMLLVLQNPVKELSLLYNGTFELMYLSFSATLFLLMITSCLGVTGSWIVLRYQLKKIQPE